MESNIQREKKDQQLKQQQTNRKNNPGYTLVQREIRANSL